MKTELIGLTTKAIIHKLDFWKIYEKLLANDSELLLTHEKFMMYSLSVFDFKLAMFLLSPWPIFGTC